MWKLEGSGFLDVYWVTATATAVDPLLRVLTRTYVRTVICLIPTFYSVSACSALLLFRCSLCFASVRPFI